MRSVTERKVSKLLKSICQIKLLYTDFLLNCFVMVCSWFVLSLLSVKTPGWLSSIHFFQEKLALGRHIGVGKLYLLFYFLQAGINTETQARKKSEVYTDKTVQFLLSVYWETVETTKGNHKLHLQCSQEEHRVLFTIRP